MRGTNYSGMGDYACVWKIWLLLGLGVCACADRIDVPHGGISLAEYVLGELPTLDYRGEQTLMFVVQPSLDKHVSAALLEKGWEVNLNQLYKTLLDEEKPASYIATLDVGANLGAFSLYVASLGRKLYSFEMQPNMQMLLELSRRVNNFNRMTLFHAALWNETGKEISFTPVRGNFGGTGARSDSAGAIKMHTNRLDDFFLLGSEVFFMKIDVEGAEEYVLQGFSNFLAQGRVKHLVMETRRNQAFIVAWFYDLGFKCGLYDRTLFDKAAFVSDVAKIGVETYNDIYCRWIGGGKASPLVSRRSLYGVYEHGSGWR